MIGKDVPSKEILFLVSGLVSVKLRLTLRMVLKLIMTHNGT